MRIWNEGEEKKKETESRSVLLAMSKQNSLRSSTSPRRALDHNLSGPHFISAKFGSLLTFEACGSNEGGRSFTDGPET